MRTRNVSFLYVMLLGVILGNVSPGDVAAQGWTKVQFAERPTIIEPAVGYISKAPMIDGKLDDDLTYLPPRKFSTLWKSDPDNPDIPVSYRLAYGTRFLYVYIEAAADELTYRDRAYQNGDGFTVVLTVPQPDNVPSDEFYVLGCSAVDRRQMEWTRTIFWYYNVDNIFLKTSDEMKMEFRDGDGMIHFELLLPWQDVHPYHPWLSEGIGFNLGMTKAIGDKGRNIYRSVDAGIGTENSPREYALLSFEDPRHLGEPQTFARPVRSNISVGDSLAVDVVTIAEEPFAEKLSISLESGEKTTISRKWEKYDCGAGLTRRKFFTESARQPAGGYAVKWSSDQSECRGETGLTILPPFDFQALEHRLQQVKKVLTAGSFTTFQFEIEELRAELADVYPYETAGEIRFKLSQLLNHLAVAEQGQDLFAQRRGYVRMAYRSEFDQTLQPYVAYLPEDFDPSRKYPLLVFLHGSTSTERNIIGWHGIPDGFIALCPNGRGPSNWFSWDNAQIDVAEAIRAVQSNFPIDQDRILLAGFSMGGYGVYRSFYETPDTYRAIAVFSGGPKVRFGIPDGQAVIDFNEDKYLEPFAGLPVFVFHGERDRNVSFEETEQFIAKLESAGAQVEFHTEADTGHSGPNDETMAAYHQWVERVISN